MMNVALATVGMGIWALRGIVALAIVVFAGSLIHDFAKRDNTKKANNK
jgi:hypothetical protein